MLQFRPFDAIPDIVDGIEISNPAMVERIRLADGKLSHYEIYAHVANAVTGSADAAHARAWEESHFGEASADAIVYDEYHDEIAAAWVLVADDPQLPDPTLSLPRSQEHPHE